MVDSWIFPVGYEWFLFRRHRPGVKQPESTVSKFEKRIDFCTPSALDPGIQLSEARRA
jgi:hypothetical protein